MDNQLVISTSIWPAWLAEVVATALSPEVLVPVNLLVVAVLNSDLEPLVVIEPLVLLEPDTDSTVEAEVEVAVPARCSHQVPLSSYFLQI